MKKKKVKVTKPTMKELNSWKRDDLLSLPERKWDTVSIYDSLLLISTRKKHDSGWAIMSIIGVNKQQPVEIAVGRCDDIEWKFPDAVRGSSYVLGQVRTDCCLRSGAIHFWTREGRFKVGNALSSTDVEIVKEKP